MLPRRLAHVEIDNAVARMQSALRFYDGMDGMRLYRPFLVFVLMLSVGPGCRSTSVARRERPSCDTSSSIIAGSNVRSEPDKKRSSPAETADTSDESIQQVAAQEDEESPTESASSTPGLKLSIYSALETALTQNPDLVTLRQNDAVGSAVLGVAETYPFNPYVQVQATPYQSAQNAGPGTTYHYVLLIQQIQLGGQQQFREESASKALNSIRWNILQAELLNVAQTERLYFTAIYQKGLRELSEMNVRNNEELLAIVQLQKDNGTATASDVAVVRLDLRSTQQQLRIADANYRTALLDLKRHMGISPETQIELETNITDWNWQPVSSELLAASAENRPDVMAARADVEVARANTSLADASRVPDLQLGPYYQRTDAGTSFLGFRAQMDLFVFNDGTPLLHQREAEQCQRIVGAQQIAVRAKLEAEAAADRYERARLIQKDFAVNEGHLPSAATELQQLEEQFKAQEVDIQRVLQARLSILQSRRADLDAMFELAQAAVAVTAATGRPLESLASVSPAK